MRKHLLAVSLFLPLGAAGLSAATCESLTSLKLPNTTVTAAVSVTPGAFNLTGNTTTNAGLAGMPFKELTGFCRVALTIRPSADSDIKVEVWLPLRDWNRKFLAVGNGGWAGTITYGAMSGAPAKGYAAASTDAGHQGTEFNEGRDFMVSDPTTRNPERVSHSACGSLC